MKIIFVHEVSWFNKVVYEMHDFPELLSIRGHDVHFLDFDEGKPRAKWRPITTVESRAHSGSRVSVTTPPRVLPGILGRLLATVIQPLVFRQLMRRVTPDVVITYSVPTSGWQIVKICKSKNIPVVARIIDVSHTLRTTRFALLVKWSERYVYRNADFVSTHNEALRQYCLGLGARHERSSVIYPGVDLVRFSPGPPYELLQRRYGLEPTDKVLLFMGTVFRFSGLFELLNELQDLLRQDGSLKLLVLGDGEDLCRLRSFAGSRGLQRQVLTPGRIEYDDLVAHLRLGTIALLPFRPELVTHCALPAKVLQYLATGLPTVATPLDGLMSVIRNGDGVLYTSTAQEMAEVATRLLDDDTSLSQLSVAGLRKMSELCDWTKQTKAFEQMLNDVYASS